MPLGNADETEQSNDQESGQLSFPFSVKRVSPRPESNFSGPNPYSLPPSDSELIEGGGFFYEKCPNIFLGRNGYGPLRVAWDTNILIDYAEFGELMWADPDFDPAISEPCYREELIALDTLVQIWMWRDIRVRAPERQIYDARCELDDAVWELRARELHHFLAALTCIELDKNVLENVQPFEPLAEGSTSSEWDESLVTEAIETGCHVFLSRDGGLRRRLDQTARDAFLVIMAPSDLLQALAEADELRFDGDGYILPDTHKWVHFMRATKAGEE